GATGDAGRGSPPRSCGRQSELARSVIGRAGTGPADRRRALADRMANLSYDDILARKVCVGSAAGVIDRLTQLGEELGIDGIVAELNPGRLIPPDLGARSLRLLTHEVMPAFK